MFGKPPGCLACTGTRCVRCWPTRYRQGTDGRNHPESPSLSPSPGCLTPSWKLTARFPGSSATQPSGSLSGCGTSTGSTADTPQSRTTSGSTDGGRRRCSCPCPTGKTHALCALGHRLVEAGHSVLFAPAYRLVQELLAAKRDLDLPRRLRKLDNFDFLLLDDLGYLPQGAEESEVLFTLIAERYERRSLGITSNLVFSQWEHIFANPMATAAAIDRVVHHSVILEFDVPSYRTDAAQQRGQKEEVNRQE